MRSKQNNPAVSFLIATYNRADYLDKCIQSILNQSVQDFEIIVVDDASTDQTEELIRSKYARKVIYHKNSINRGVASARNTGLDYACGDYIGLIDSDDILYNPEYLEKALGILRANKDIAVFSCDTFCIDAQGKRLSSKTFFQTTIDHRGIELTSGIKGFDYLFFHGIHSCGALVKRGIIKEIGFLNTDYNIGWDEDFFLRISAYKPQAIYYHNEPLTAYRIHSGNISNNGSRLYLEKIRCRQEILQENKAIKKRLGARTNKRLAEQYLCLIDAYLKEGNVRASVVAIFKSLFLYPLILPRLFKHGVSFSKKTLSL